LSFCMFPGERPESDDQRARMSQGDANAEEDCAADDRTEDFVAESVHLALHQSDDWRIGDGFTA